MKLQNTLYLTALLTAVQPGGPASAQQPATTTTASLEGVVVDSLTTDPIGGVLVRLDSGMESVTDRDGRFRFDGLEPGTHDLAALTGDCRVSWITVRLEEGRTESVRVRIAPPEGVLVRREGDVPLRPRSGGRLYTSTQIDEVHGVTLMEVVERLAPSLFSRGRNSLLTPAASLVVVVDGTRVSDGARTLESIRPGDVASLEIAPGASAGWEFGSSGSAGLIRVETRRGNAPSTVPSLEGCAITGWPDSWEHALTPIGARVLTNGLEYRTTAIHSR